MKYRTIFLIFIFLTIISSVYAATSSSSINWLSIGQGDQRYCMLSGTCELENLIVRNLTVTHYVNMTVINLTVTNLTTNGIYTDDYNSQDGADMFDWDGVKILSNSIFPATVNWLGSLGLEWYEIWGESIYAFDINADVIITKNLTAENITAEYIGIGTTAPEVELHVVGDTVLDGLTNITEFLFLKNIALDRIKSTAPLGMTISTLGTQINYDIGDDGNDFVLSEGRFQIRDKIVLGGGTSPLEIYGEYPLPDTLVFIHGVADKNNLSIVLGDNPVRFQLNQQDMQEFYNDRVRFVKNVSIAGTIGNSTHAYTWAELNASTPTDLSSYLQNMTDINVLEINATKDVIVGGDLMQDRTLHTIGNVNDNIIDTFDDDITGWTSDDAGNTPVSHETTNYQIGVGGMKIATTAGQSNTDVISATPPFSDWSNVDNIGFWVYSTYYDSTVPMFHVILNDDDAAVNPSFDVYIRPGRHDQWQYVIWDLSGEAAGDRDAVSSIQFEVNDDGNSPIFYIDHLRYYSATDYSTEVFTGADGGTNIIAHGGLLKLYGGGLGDAAGDTQYVQFDFNSYYYPIISTGDAPSGGDSIIWNTALTLSDNKDFAFGSGTDNRLRHSTVGNDHLNLYIPVGSAAQSGMFIISKEFGTDFGHGIEDNPRIYLHSATQDEVAVDEWGSFQHDTFNFLVTAGKGNITLMNDTAIRGDLYAEGNATAQNVFLPQYIFSHTDATLVVEGASEWTNITFSQEDDAIKQGISHVFNDATNHTFTIMESGIYNIDYDIDVEDTSPSASDIDVAARLTFLDGTEVPGSVFETDITKQGAEVELSHNFLASCNAGDTFVFQFIAEDANVQISTHGTFGDHPESATIIMDKTANLP